MALAAIVADKRRAVTERMALRPLESFRGELSPTSRDFVGALRARRTGFILECKKASPSRGLIRERFDPVAIAHSYAPFADAISVLTDEPYFQGSFEVLRAVRRAAPQPILCKDFVVDPYQIYEARGHGADAILLMCSVLDQAALLRCLAATRELKMGALVEVHDEAELTRALDADAEVIGINNRNLATLEVDLETSRRLAPLVPHDKISICESGIESVTDVRGLRQRVDAFLIGSSLMEQDDLDAAVRRMIFGRVKICGLTDRSQAQHAHDSGASHGGLVLWPHSKRAVDRQTAARVRDGVALDWVGVFVDQHETLVATAALDLDLCAVQLHGDEDAGYISRLRALLPEGCAVWKALRVGDARNPQPDSTKALGADRLLLDSYHPNQRGGTGQPFQWDLVRSHAERTELIVSGGIGPNNADEAARLGCWAVDLSSGVERAAGDKDPAAVNALFAALRGSGKDSA